MCILYQNNTQHKPNITCVYNPMLKLQCNQFIISLAISCVHMSNIQWGLFKNVIIYAFVTPPPPHNAFCVCD